MFKGRILGSLHHGLGHACHGASSRLRKSWPLVAVPGEGGEEAGGGGCDIWRGRGVRANPAPRGWGTNRSSGHAALVLAWVRDGGEFLPASVTADYPVLILVQSLVLFLPISFFLPLPSAIPSSLGFGFRVYPSGLHTMPLSSCVFLC
jgi:hypothetical protein